MSFHDFPEDLVPELLSRLPFKSMLRFKLVSKQWLKIIKSRKFSLMHASKSSSSTTQICLCKSIEGNDHDEYKLCEIKWSGGVDGVTKEFLPLPNEISNKPQLIGSCNGVLCLVCRGESNAIIVWNPLSNNIQRLPPLPQPLPPKSYGGRHICTYGFGYDEVNDDYKVLCFQVSWKQYHRFSPEGLTCMKDDAEDRAIVYSLKSKTWRSIKKFPIPIEEGDAGVLFRGSLHWLSKDGRPPLTAFDLSKEEFKLCSGRPTRGHLGILLDGRLCVTRQVKEEHYIVSIMSSYNRWEEFRFVSEGGDDELKPIFAGYQIPLEKKRRLTPIACVERPKPLVMMYQEGSENNVFFYDFKTKPVIKGEASNMEFSREVFPYIKTLEFYNSKS